MLQLHSHNDQQMFSGNSCKQLGTMHLQMQTTAHSVNNIFAAAFSQQKIARLVFLPLELVFLYKRVLYTD